MASMRPAQPQAITKVSISALVISLPIIYVSLLRVPPSALARDSTFWFLMSNSIIAIIAADSGVLFFSPASHNHYDDVAPGDQPAETVQEGYCDAMLSVPLMAPHEPMAPANIGGFDQLPAGGVVSCKTTDEAGVEEGYALALVKGEGDTDHASLLQKREEEEEEAPEPLGSNKNDTMIVEGDQWIIPQAQVTVTLDDRDESSPGAEEMRPRCSVTEETDKPPPPEEEEEEPAYWQLSDEELNRKVEEFITRFNRDMVEQEAAVC